MRYKYDTSEAAYDEAVRRIKKAKPNWKHNLTGSKSLDLSGMGLTSIPPDLTELIKLEELNISNNQLAEIPPELAQLSNLQRLDLSKNRLTAVPPELARLSKLTIFDLSSNQLTIVPPELGKLSNLFIFNLSKNQLISVPPELGQLSKLFRFDLSENRLISVPSEISQMSKLSRLDLSTNKLTIVPSEFSRLSDLTYLDLSNNPDLPILPAPKIKVTLLKRNVLLNYLRDQEIYIEASNRIERAGDESDILLNLAAMDLTVIPHKLFELSNLEILALSNNKLTVIPPELAQLSNLKVLDLSDNQLTAIPPELVQLSNLRVFRLDNNPDLPLPSEIVVQRFDAQVILDYLQEKAVITEALHRIEQAKEKSASMLNLEGLGLTAVPPELAQLSKLKILNLNNNELATIPSELAKLSSLEILFVSENMLITVPYELAKLSNLKELHLNNNQLKSIPSELAQLSKLTKLDLNDNSDLIIPSGIIAQVDSPQAIFDYLRALRRMAKLKDESATTLDLKGYGLTGLPSIEITELSQLTEVDLSNNQLTEIPLEIIQLANLEQLRLRGNQLTTIPPELGQMANLEILDLKDNQLTAVPPELIQLSKLTEIDLSNNKLTEIPLEITRLASLERFGFSGNHLTSVPPELAHLSELKDLDLSDNKLISVPTEFAQMTNLKKLSLGDNLLTDIPLEIAQLSSLERLYLGSNQLTTILPELTQLSNLRVLYLDNNQLTDISPDFAQLSTLEKLNLNSNQLTGVPPELAQLVNLKEFYLSNNPDLPIPPEIVSQGDKPQAILDYLHDQQEEPPQPLNEAKLILVGQGGVGKTSLVRRLTEGRFNPNEKITKGIRIQPWKVEVPRPDQNHATVQLNIWDFGGQEIMHATHQFFLTERSLYLLVLNARQGEDEGRVEYWLSLINSFAADAPVLIVINQIDQQQLDIDGRGLKKKYPVIVDFISTSARDNVGMEDLKAAIIDILVEMEHIDTLFPASWMRVKEELTNMQTERNFLPYLKYQKLCQLNGVEEDSSQRTLVRFLHDLGIVLNFQDDDRVNDTNVLNPGWVTDGVYALLNSLILKQQYGVLHREQLADILPVAAYSSDQYRFLLEMMLKFELAYEMDRQRLLIPGLLAKEEPGFEWEEDGSLHFAYQYHVLPHSVLHRFMVRQYIFIDPDIRWRTGVLLQHDGLSALVKADIEAKTIRIAINGQGNRRQFLYSLRLVFAGIHESITGIKPEEVVPIPGYPDVPSLPYSYLEKLETMNAPDQQLFPGMDTFFSVQQLLGNVTTTAMRQSGLLSHTTIVTNLRDYFDNSDFHDLLLELGIDRDDLPGESPNDRKRECVLYLEKQGRLPELVALMTEKRPHIELEEE